MILKILIFIVVGINCFIGGMLFGASVVIRRYKKEKEEEIERKYISEGDEKLLPVVLENADEPSLYHKNFVDCPLYQRRQKIWTCFFNCRYYHQTLKMVGRNFFIGCSFKKEK